MNTPGGDATAQKLGGRSVSWTWARRVAAPWALAAVGACHGEPAPAGIRDEAPPPAPTVVSRLSAPIEYDFTAVLPLIERAVPRHLGSMDSVRRAGLDPRKHYAFEAERGPFTAFAEGDQMHLRTTIAYTARAFYKPFLGPTVSAGCGKGDERPRLVLELTTPLTLGPNWHLRSHAKLARLEAASALPRDRCSVTMLSFDVTARVIEAARSAIRRKLPDVDRKIAAVDLRDHFESWWALLGRPIRLSDGVWLILAPERVDIGQVTGQGHVLTVPVNVGAHPRIVTADAAPATELVALPPLGRATTSDGFHVTLEGAVDYGTASGAVANALANRRLTQAGRSVTVNGVSVASAGRGRVALTVAFTGDAQGSLRFVGSPVIDAARGEITVPDLDYDLETDAPLFNAYAWLRSDALRAAFREKARIPVALALQHGRSLLLDGLNRRIGGAVSLRGTVDSVAVRALYVTRAGLIVRAQASGQASLAVRPE